jgi:hypothetical protein
MGYRIIALSTSLFCYKDFVNIFKSKKLVITLIRFINQSDIMPIQWYRVSEQVKVVISLHFSIIPFNFIIYFEFNGKFRNEISDNILKNGMKSRFIPHVRTHSNRVCNSLVILL